MTSSNNLSLFNFNQQQVRVMAFGGEPWFVAMDVLYILGHQQSSHSAVLQKLEAGETFLYRVQKGTKGLRVLSEAAMYKIVMRSDKPLAKPFQDWVTRDVLPAIRKDGMYVMGEEKAATEEMSLEEMTIKVMSALQAKVSRLTIEKEEAVVKLAVAENELNFLTVDEFRALKHWYLTQPQRIKLSLYAKAYSISAGLPITKQVRFLPSIGKDTSVNVYHREALEHAAGVMGLV